MIQVDSQLEAINTDLDEAFRIINDLAGRMKQLEHRQLETQAELDRLRRDRLR
jgi:hypothetical protein